MPSMVNVMGSLGGESILTVMVCSLPSSTSSSVAPWGKPFMSYEPEQLTSLKLNFASYLLVAGLKSMFADAGSPFIELSRTSLLAALLRSAAKYMNARSLEVRSVILTPSLSFTENLEVPSSRCFRSSCMAVG